MALHKEIFNCLKVEENRELKSIIDISDKIKCDEEPTQKDSGNETCCNTVKRYQRCDLLSLRNAQLSVHYPQCALRREMQVLSIWTCRLRCELQYLGLWKLPNTGNSYGNCSGSCQSYACDSQPYPCVNSQSSAGYSQMCYGGEQKSQQVQLQQINSSPTLINKKAVRSRERILNYQRSINTELIRATSPSSGGDSSIQYHLNQIKPAFVDHRSISSSHLMPAFAKRRMCNANSLHSQYDAASHYNTNDGHSLKRLANDEGAGGNASHFEASVKPRKESVKPTVNQTSANTRVDKSDQLLDSQSGWMNMAKNTNSDFPTSNNKQVNVGSVNKKLIYERRIGSGRLVPREVNWDVRPSGNNKIIEKELSNIVNKNEENDKDTVSGGEVDKLNNRISSIGRFSDLRTQDRRIFDRRVSSSEDSGSCNASKIYCTSNFTEERNNTDSNYQQKTSHFTGQRSMSFRRREFLEYKDHHRDFRDLRETKDSREGRENREQRGDHHHNHHREQKDEPEWFSEGPTSQHDTIELRGFEETEDSQSQQVQRYSDQLPKTAENESTETSMHSLNSSSIINLSTKDIYAISSEIATNSNNDIANSHAKDMVNGNSYNNVKEAESQNKEITNNIEAKPDIPQIELKSEEFGSSDKRRPNGTEFFFDSFLNIEALENTLTSSENDQLNSVTNEDVGTSRFSRWFFSSSNNNLNNNDEFSNNTLNKGDSKQLKKDLNESEFNSFMSFLKYNNFPTPELPKALPSNVSALSVEELEARMRKMDAGKVEKSKINGGDQNMRKNESNHTKCENESDANLQSAETNTQDVEAFQKLLDQLGKPRTDISANIIMPNTPGQQHSLTTQVGPYPPIVSPIYQPSNSSSLSNIAKQEYVMKIMQQQQQIMHHQQNMGKMIPSLLQVQSPNHRISQIPSQPEGEDIPLMPGPHLHHSHHMPIVLNHNQKRLDVQHLIQSVVREELSRGFLEKELKNPNIPPYTREIISTVLNETFYNSALSGNHNAPDSIEAISNDDASTGSLNLIQYTPTQRELQMHTHAIMQNALFKKKIEIEQHEALRRRQEIHKQLEFEAVNITQQHHQLSLNSNTALSQQGHHQSSRQINSPTPLAFTPTSVLRKMTADKESITSQATTITSPSAQELQPHLQQPHLKTAHSQISYQHSNQPRMILGGGNFQYIQQHQIATVVANVNGSPQISPQQKSQIRSQPSGPLKWPLVHQSVESNHSVLNNMGNKPMGRPILKGPGPIQTLVTQSSRSIMPQNQPNVNQTSQSIDTVSQISKYSSIQHPRQIVGQQFSGHLMQHQIPTSQQNNIQHQLFQQRSVVMQRQQIQQNDLGNHASLQQPPTHQQPCNDNNSITNINFQRDGGLSPTSNQLAQWFSPELLAQASAGKLPLLNINQALSLEEFERSIQHSSTAVNN